MTERKFIKEIKKSNNTRERVENILHFLWHEL